jgi:hypothetical protein
MSSALNSGMRNAERFVVRNEMTFRVACRVGCAAGGLSQQ